ncbi:MAG: MATE family efflux transporter [Candidatus Goldbacteria bacterium]|nr:MATE family efflux transporter [Candidatus Goldiibacteriota bacterium]
MVTKENMIKQKKEIDLTNGNILYNLFYLSWPILVLNIIQNTLSVVDVFLLGKIGVTAMSAISISYTILSLFWSSIGGLSAGCIAVVSRLSGEKRYDELNRFLPIVILSGLLVWILNGIIILSFLEPILTFFGAKGETLELAKSYMKIILIGFFNPAILFMCFAIFRGIGLSVMPFYLLGTSVILQMIFMPLFIFGFFGFPKLGLPGSAVAYIVATTGPTIAGLIILFNGIKNVQLQISNFKINFINWLKYIRISIPAMTQGWIANIAWLFLLKIVSKYGDNLIATVGVGSRIDVMLMMIGWAIGSSVSIMVGHNLGAKEIKRAEETAITALKVYSFFTLAWFLLCFNFGSLIIKAFNTNQDVVFWGSQYLKFVSPFYLLMGVGLITAMALNGAGSTKTTMVINFIAFFIFQLPIAFILSEFTSVRENGIFIGIASAFVFQGIAGWIMFRKGGWKYKKVY